MTETINRLTFGFLMAQLFPGAVAVFAVSFAYLAWQHDLPGSVLASVNVILKTWSDASAAHRLFLLGLCVGFGMFIHGMHWTLLGGLEQSGNASIFRSSWNSWRLYRQLITAPLRLLYEGFHVLFQKGGICNASIEENVARVDEGLMKQHEFLQDFYLYPAQFFAHMTFALASAMCSLAVYMVNYGLTSRRVWLFILILAAISAFFVLSRVQLLSLFDGERVLVGRSTEYKVASHACTSGNNDKDA